MKWIIITAFFAAAGCAADPGFICDPKNATDQCIHADGRYAACLAPFNRCGVPASDCASGWRFDTNAGDKAGHCVVFPPGVTPPPPPSGGVGVDMTQAPADQASPPQPDLAIPADMSQPPQPDLDPPPPADLAIPPQDGGPGILPDMWTQDPSPVLSNHQVTNGWGPAPGELWAVGTPDVVGPGATVSQVFHFVGGAWSSMDSPTMNQLWALWGSSASDVWFVGSTGSPLHYSSGSWTINQDPALKNHGFLNGIWGSGPSDVWTVGGGGTILHYDGNKWSPSTSGTTNYLGGVWGSGAGDVWATGADYQHHTGVVLHFANSQWSPATTATAPLLNIWGSSAGDIWVVGVAGTMLHYAGGAWSPIAPTTSSDLYGIWGSQPNDVYAVGTSGAVLHWNGVNWVGATVGMKDLYGVWGTGPTDVNLFGNFGTVLHGQ